MPRYSSRVGAGASKPLKRKKRVGGAKNVKLKKAGLTGGTLKVGGGSGIASGISTVKGSGIVSGGSAPVGGSAIVGGSLDKITYPQMISVLNNMSPDQFHHLQGVASAHVNQDHPLRDITRQSLGGSFIHPKSFSQIATKDILKAISSQQLSSALHSEMLDMIKGRDVGGGLFSSLKHHFKVGLSKLRSGLPHAVMIGKKLRSALQTGLSIAKEFAPIVEQVFPSLGALAKTSIAGGEAVEKALSVGIGIGEKVAQSVESVSKQVESVATQ